MYVTCDMLALALWDGNALHSWVATAIWSGMPLRCIHGPHHLEQGSLCIKYLYPARYLHWHTVPVVVVR